MSLEIARGQVVGILGPNGAGKSTTVRMIAAILPPSEGTVSVDGLDTIADSRPVRRRLGYLPEAAPAYPEMPVEAFLKYRASLFEIRGKARRAAIDRAIDRCWLKEARHRRIGQLSKGYRQRVGLAAALLHDPPLLILDEPTSGLDPSQIAETRSLIRDLAGNHTTLLVSHILPEVEKTCDRIIVFARGRVQADGAPRDLLQSGGAARAVVVEMRPPAGSGGSAGAVFASVPGAVVQSSEGLEDSWVRCTVALADGSGGEADPRERVLGACVSAGWRVRELRSRADTLEDLYLRLVHTSEAALTA